MTSDEATRPDPTSGRVAEVFRLERSRVLARLIGLLRDFDLAEESLQDAFVAAMATWPRDGVPTNPAGWLVTTAKRRALDRLRRASALERRHRAWGELAVAWTPGDPTAPIADDRLRLIFTCCHPSLTVDAQVALTLRTLGGLTTDEVARAFLVPEATLAQRLVRAKAKIRNAAIPYRVPESAELPSRLGAVLSVVYLVFNAGYLASSGAELVRVDLCDEAIRLVTLLTDLMADQREVWGLAALLHLQDSRRSARTGADGRVLTLEEQDRSRWDHDRITEGLRCLARARDTSDGPYVIKAALAAVHARTTDPAATNWREIVDLYDRLLAIEPTAVVALNRAVAVAMATAPEHGLALLDDVALAEPLARYHLYHVARADLLRRAGQLDRAIDAYGAAREQTDNAAEREFIDRRLSELQSASR